MRFRFLYGGTIFVSSLLLFLVQPMMAKAILPWFGGSAGVWTSAMLFFQVVLLLGYWWAHWTTAHLTPRTQAGLHAAMLAGSLLLLPVGPSAAFRLVEARDPIFRIVAVLATSVGLPYLLLCANGPLIQMWYARRTKAAFPYRLFAISNVGSLAALMAYPFAIEPWISVRHQLAAWSVGYAVLALLAAAAAFVGTRGTAAAPSKSSPTPTGERLLWIALAACPSILWLAVAGELSQNVAPIPFLWILPLSLYLLSFILCFDREGWYRPAIFRIALPAAWVLIWYCLFRRGAIGSIQWTILLLSLALFICCMFCHGELARRKPDARELTSYYLMLALGGALGGVFVGLAAPLLFNQYLELPAGVSVCMLLAMALLYGYPPRRLLRLGLMVAAGLVIAVKVGGYADGALVRERNFYGALKVSQVGSGDAAMLMLSNGPIRHGTEFIAPDKSRVATTYYSPDSGVALAVRLMQKRADRVGIIGLGTGTLASYGRRGDFYRFYELDPAVIEIANTEFRYLRECPCRMEVVPGDARLALEREAPQDFDVFVVDAFSGDSIPVHLLTREAFALYYRNLKPDGILVVNVTNRYLNLSPVVETLARAGGRLSRVFTTAADPEHGYYAATWVVVTANREAMAALPDSPGAPDPQRAPLWTDDYTNLFRVLR
jgi:spermidine synthase